MVRHFTHMDMDRVLQIWLDASVSAHHFIPSEFWQSQVEAMRTQYLPVTTISLFELEGYVVGFTSYHGDTLAAIFVDPLYHHQGIGSALIDALKAEHSKIVLSAYQANNDSFQFYQKNGFQILREEVDEHTNMPAFVMKWEKEIER